MHAGIRSAIPWFGVRKYARELQKAMVKLRADQRKFVTAIARLRRERDHMKAQMAELGTLSALELEQQRARLQQGLEQLRAERREAIQASDRAVSEARTQLEIIRQAMVETEETALLQEVGVYRYRHPLADAVSYQKELALVQERIQSMAKDVDAAVAAPADWVVNGSLDQGRVMVKETARLMLRAFNVEADSLVRSLEPYKLDAAVAQLTKAAHAIAHLGRTMSISLSESYVQARVAELELTADFLNRRAEDKEAERAERERIRQERKAQHEMEWERERLQQKRAHDANVLLTLLQRGDDEAAAHMRERLRSIDHAIESVDFRAANVRAGYVYVISNIGSLGPNMVKIGMTRRLDPLDRIRELSDASVPFDFDVHAVFFSKDAAGIEAALHERLANRRVNQVNTHRKFFRVTPAQVKAQLTELAGDLLQFQDVPAALEYRQSQVLARASATNVSAPM